LRVPGILWEKRRMDAYQRARKEAYAATKAILSARRTEREEARKTTKEKDRIQKGEIYLFLMSMLSGLVVLMLGYSLLVGIFFVFLYSLLAFFIVPVCAFLRRLAQHYEEGYEPWTLGQRLHVAAFWPVMLIFSLVVYPLMAFLRFLFYSK
jgi:uncharacterized membrane protein